jgi:hypothetical protein
MNNRVTVNNIHTAESYTFTHGPLSSLNVVPEGETIRVTRRDWDGREEHDFFPASSYRVHEKRPGWGCWVQLLILAGVIAALLVCGGGGPLG